MRGLLQTLRDALGTPGVSEPAAPNQPATAQQPAAAKVVQTRHERWTLRDTETGDTYRIECRWNSHGRYYDLFILERPASSYRVGYGQGHVLDENRICVATGREPTTTDRAKAIAIHWLRGFSRYRHTGQFPNGQVRVDVKDVN